MNELEHAVTAVLRADAREAAMTTDTARESEKLHARLDDYGFIQTPYRKVSKGKVLDDVVYMTADEEEKFKTPIRDRSGVKVQRLDDALTAFTSGSPWRARSASTAG